MALVWVGALWLIAQLGSLALLGWAVCLLFYIRAGLIVRATLAAIELPSRPLLEACRPGLAVTALVGMTSFAVDSALAPTLGHGPALLAIDMSTCAIAFLVGLRLGAHLIAADIIRLMSELSHRIPGGAGPPLLRLVLGRRAAVPPQA